MPSSSRSPTVAYASDSVPATIATMPGVIHSVTVTPKAISVLRSADAERRRAWPAPRRRTPRRRSSCLISGLLSSSRTTASTTNITAQIGQRHAHPGGERDRLAGRLLDEVAADQVRRAADRGEQATDAGAVREHQHQRDADPQPGRVECRRRTRSPLSCISLAITARMPSAVGSSIATVAVLDTNADSSAGDHAERDDHPGRAPPDARGSPAPGRRTAGPARARASPAPG